MKKDRKKSKNVGAILLTLTLGIVAQVLILPLYWLASVLANWLQAVSPSLNYSPTLATILLALLFIGTFAVFLFRTPLLLRAIFVTIPLQVSFIVFSVFVSGLFKLPNYIMQNNFLGFLPIYLILPILVLIYLKFTKRSALYYISVAASIVLYFLIMFVVR